MPCPQCGERTDVYDSRLNGQKLIRRRRSCRACGFRFATVEVMNVFHPLGKKEKPDAPTPEPPERISAKKRRAKAAPVKEGNPVPWGGHIAPWNDDDDDDFRDYIDLPRSLDDE